MSKLVVTNVRLPKELLAECRALALEQGKSLSTLVRDLLEQYIHQVKVLGAAEAPLDPTRRREDEPIWSMRPSCPEDQEGTH